MKTKNIVFKHFCAICIIFLGVLFLYTNCAERLNDFNSESFEKLAELAGISHKSNDSKTQNDSSTPNAPSTSTTTTYSDSKTGILSDYGDYITYSFNAYSSVNYTISISNGTGAKMSYYAGANATFSTSYFSPTTENSKSFIPSSSGTVYIFITPSNESYTGAFKLTVSNNDGKEVTLNQYANGTFTKYSSQSDTISNSSGYCIYRFYARADMTYTISMSNDTGAKNSYSVGTDSITPTSCFDTTTENTKTFKPSSSCEIYIKVMPTSSSYTGSFTLTVSCDTCAVALYKYKESTEVNNLSCFWTSTTRDYHDIYFYSFYAYSDTTYTVSISNEDGAKMYYSAGTDSVSPTSFFPAITDNNKQFVPSSSGIVYIKVGAVGPNHTGTYTITVSNNNGKDISLSRNYKYSSYVNYHSASQSATISSTNGYYIFKSVVLPYVTYTISISNDAEAKMSYSAGIAPSSPTSFFSATTENSKYFSTSASGTVYIKVKPIGSSYTGSFTLTLSAESEKISMLRLTEYSSYS